MRHMNLCVNFSIEKWSPVCKRKAATKTYENKVKEYMDTNKKYFAIGVFILCGLSVLIAGIIIFGSGQFFQKDIIIETYFNGSVQGLDVGSPVKYRGVKIGDVKEIGTVNYFYDLSHLSSDERYSYGLYVMVLIRISEKSFKLLPMDDIEKELTRLVRKKGLRLKIDYIGITGLAFLNLDFADPKTSPPLKIKWEPKNYYIPIVPNTIQLVTESINDISKSLTSDFIPLIENLNTASANLPQLTEKLNETLASLAQSFDTVSTVAKEIPSLSEKLNETLFHINQVFTTEAYDVEDIIANIRQITDDLKAITEELKYNPSRVLFGAAPRKVEKE